VIIKSNIRTVIVIYVIKADYIIPNAKKKDVIKENGQRIDTVMNTDNNLI
jgi:hypothetical protein